MRKRVVVTGLGCISPLGNNVDETWEALLAGKSGAAFITHFDASHHKTKFAAEVKGFDGVALFGVREARKMDRFTQFAMAATLEALSHANFSIDASNRDRVGVLIGSGIGGISTLLEQAEVMRERGPDRLSPFLIPMMISDSAAGMIAIQLGARPGEHACQVLHILQRAVQVAEIGPIGFIAVNVEKDRLREFLRHDLHGVHIAKRCADNQIEILACQFAENLLRVVAFRHVLEASHVCARQVLIQV